MKCEVCLFSHDYLFSHVRHMILFLRHDILTRLSFFHVVPDCSYDVRSVYWNSHVQFQGIPTLRLVFLGQAQDPPPPWPGKNEPHLFFTCWSHNHMWSVCDLSIRCVYTGWLWACLFDIKWRSLERSNLFFIADKSHAGRSVIFLPFLAFCCIVEMMLQHHGQKVSGVWHCLCKQQFFSNTEGETNQKAMAHSRAVNKLPETPNSLDQ